MRKKLNKMTINDFIAQRPSQNQDDSLFERVLGETPKFAFSDAGYLIAHVWKNTWELLEDSKKEQPPLEIIALQAEIAQALDLMGALGIISSKGVSYGHQAVAVLTQSRLKQMIKTSNSDQLTIQLNLHSKKASGANDAIDSSCLH